MPHSSSRWTRRAFVLLLAVWSTSAAAQGAKRAAGWTVLFDRPVADTTIAMGAMAPGWHVTADSTMPGAITYDPALVAARTMRLESEVIFFSGAPSAGAGLMVGGQDLSGRAPRFIAFTVYPDGRYSVSRSSGSRRVMLVPPTVNVAIPRHPGGTAQIPYQLILAGDENYVTFSVNGRPVTQLARTFVDPIGTVGLRFEPGVNAHITTFLLNGKNAAPERAKKP